MTFLSAPRHAWRFTFSIAIAAGLLPTTVHAAAADRPNIVLFFADDLGWGDLGCYGHPTIATPQLDDLARRGVRLTSFYSAPSCVPARMQLMLGKYPGRINLGGGTGPGGAGGIPESERPLPKVLKAAGYETAMIGKWHLGYAQDRFLPTGQGFDSWFGLPYSNDMVRPWVQTDVPLWLYENNQKIEHPVNHDTLLGRYTRRAVEFIRRPRPGPFFLYFASAMVHLPLAAGERFRGRSRAGPYGDAVEEIDWAIGEIRAALRDSGQERNTVVIFTSDNGPWINLPPRMLQAGNLPWHVGSAGALRDSKGSTYEGGVRVPAILHWPGRFEGGRTSADMAATLDLYATLIRLGTGAPPTSSQTDGYDLTAFLEGRAAQSPRAEFFYFTARQPNAVRVGPWKLRQGEQVELFHLELDPSERHNRAGELPERVAELRQRLSQMAGDAVRPAQRK
jgi:arylsulfatase A-like enzyme